MVTHFYQFKAQFEKYVSYNFQKRLFLIKRHYYYAKLGGPFSIVLALPDKYGLNTVRHIENLSGDSWNHAFNRMKESQFWKIHPEWLVK